MSPRKPRSCPGKPQTFFGAIRVESTLNFCLCPGRPRTCVRGIQQDPATPGNVQDVRGLSTHPHHPDYGPLVYYVQYLTVVDSQANRTMASKSILDGLV